jgi:hypothetical protein
MGQTCMICPGCGYKECGTNTCPNCGLVNDNGVIRREKEEFLLCPDCGHAEKGCFFYCPRCKNGIMKIVEAGAFKSVNHIWNGTELTCRCNGRVHVTMMSPDIANEIPYCPFCLEELSERPVLRIEHVPQKTEPLQVVTAFAMVMPPMPR